MKIIIPLILISIVFFVFAKSSIGENNDSIPATDFRLADLNGDTVALNDYKGSWVMIELWAIHCKPCIKELPYYENLKKKFKDENIVFISICVEKDIEKWKQFVKQKELTGIQLNTESFRNFRGYFETKNGNLIAKITRFVIINKDGFTKIKDAPRPSGSEIEKLLRKFVKD